MVVCVLLLRQAAKSALKLRKGSMCTSPSLKPRGATTGTDATRPTEDADKTAQCTVWRGLSEQCAVCCSWHCSAWLCEAALTVVQLLFPRGQRRGRSIIICRWMACRCRPCFRCAVCLLASLLLPVGGGGCIEVEAAALQEQLRRRLIRACQLNERSQRRRHAREAGTDSVWRMENREWRGAQQPLDWRS